MFEIDPNPGLIDAIGVRGPLTAELAAQQVRGPRKFNSDIDGYQHVHRIGLTNRTDWDLGPVQLVNIFGYRNTKLRYNTNTDRSEEHTSVLPSLMRISYAVFCLKKNITITSIVSSIYLSLYT